MAQLKVPEAPREYTTHYRNLLGVDYQNDQTEVHQRRSPEMVNMISDLGGNPVKRSGYRVVGNAYVGIVSVNGDPWGVKQYTTGLRVFKFEISEDGTLNEPNLIIHIDNSEHCGEVNRVLCTGSVIYILCEKAWYSYDTVNGTQTAVGEAEDVLYRVASGYAVSKVPDRSLIPTIMTMYQPNGKSMITLPEGTDITGTTKGVNLLTPFRTIEYCVTTDTASETKFVIPMCSAAAYLNVEVLDPETFEWVGAVVAKTMKYIKGINGTYYTRIPGADSPLQSLVYEPYIAFMSGTPYVKVVEDNEPHLRFRSRQTVDVPAGVPNVRITYAPFDMTDVHVEDDPVVLATENPQLAPSAGETVTFTLADSYSTKESYNSISVFRSYTDVTPEVTFTAGTASTSGDYSYDGNKTISYTKPAGSSAAGGIGTVKYYIYAVYKGLFNDKRSAVLETDVISMFDSRLFAAYKNYVYYSRAAAPFVMDDNFYISVDDDVVQLLKVSSSLAIVGEDVGSNNIYLAKGEYNETLAMPVYSIKTTSAAVGSVSKNVNGILNDEPLILSSSGIYGISTNYLSEKYTISRSGKIDRALAREQNLENAVGISFNNYFWLAINGHMYVLDGRHRDSSKYGDSSYECYYFNNMPDIKAMYVLNKRMYFTDGVYTYSWNDDLAQHVRYYDNLVIDPETGDPSGTPVKARWCSLFDDDGAPQRLKTLMKKGTVALLIPYYHTGCEVYLVKDGDVWQYLGRFDSTMTTFDYFDFIEVDFSSNVVSADIFTKKKIKKYKRLQIVLENNEPEPFGLVGVTKTYTFGNYAKR